MGCKQLKSGPKLLDKSRLSLRLPVLISPIVLHSGVIDYGSYKYITEFTLETLATGLPPREFEASGSAEWLSV